MKYTSIAQSNIKVSQLGLGTVKFGRNVGVKYPESFQLPSDQDILKLLSSAQELEINLLDTAPAYGTSEERLGKLLKGQRDQWVLSTKVGEEFEGGFSRFDFSPEAMRKSVERSLKRLQTDFLDIVLVHSSGEDERLILEENVFDTLSRMKQEGFIRAFGMSTKTEIGGKLAVDHSDIAMVTYNPVDTQEKSVIDYAHQKNKGIFIKKALASGHLNKIAPQNAVQTAMQFILREPGVTSVIIGTLNPAHLEEVVEAVATR